MMPRPVRLSDELLSHRMTSLPEWAVEHGKLHREFQFEDFVEAFGFMARVALVAESMNHHPEWSNVWNRVVVDLSTHDAGGITELDLELARRMDRMLVSGD
jgi:4a-hydroxytetrahydrobiopterin dehydratase